MFKKLRIVELVPLFFFLTEAYNSSYHIYTLSFMHTNGQRGMKFYRALNII